MYGAVTLSPQYTNPQAAQPTTTIMATPEPAARDGRPLAKRSPVPGATATVDGGYTAAVAAPSNAPPATDAPDDGSEAPGVCDRDPCDTCTVAFPHTLPYILDGRALGDAVRGADPADASPTPLTFGLPSATFLLRDGGGAPIALVRLHLPRHSLRGVSPVAEDATDATGVRRFVVEVDICRSGGVGVEVINLVDTREGRRSWHDNRWLMATLRHDTVVDLDPEARGRVPGSNEALPNMQVQYDRGADGRALWVHDNSGLQLALTLALSQSLAAAVDTASGPLTMVGPEKRLTLTRPRGRVAAHLRLMPPLMAERLRPLTSAFCQPPLPTTLPGWFGERVGEFHGMDDCIGAAMALNIKQQAEAQAARRGMGAPPRVLIRSGGLTLTPDAAPAEPRPRAEAGTLHVTGARYSPQTALCVVFRIVCA